MRLYAGSSICNRTPNILRVCIYNPMIILLKGRPGIDDAGMQAVQNDLLADPRIIVPERERRGRER